MSTSNDEELDKTGVKRGLNERCRESLANVGGLSPRDEWVGAGDNGKVGARDSADVPGDMEGVGDISPVGELGRDDVSTDAVVEVEGIQAGRAWP